MGIPIKFKLDSNRRLKLKIPVGFIIPASFKLKNYRLARYSKTIHWDDCQMMIEYKNRRYDRLNISSSKKYLVTRFDFLTI
jgi:hypothetical protein